MSIIKSIITENLLQKDGRRDITEVHTDHLGIKHFVRWSAQLEDNVNAIMLARISSLEKDLIEHDLDDVISQIQAEVPFNKIVLKYITNLQAVKAILLWAFKNRAWEAWKVISLVDSLTDLQLKNILGIDQIKVNKIRARILGLEDIKAKVEIDDANVES